MDPRQAALVALGGALRETGYRFTTVTPETHRRVDARAAAAGRAHASTVRDVFGWSRPFVPGLLAPRLTELAQEAVVLEREGVLVRATVRFSTLGDRIFVHSAYPTHDADAVFFGPDTVRFCELVASQRERARRVVDVGCGSGAGGIVAAERAERVTLADVNPAALALAEVNASLAGILDRVQLVRSDVLGGVDGDVDLVLANPPYMRDGASRTYRDGGGAFGEALGVRIVRESLARLARGGRLVLYTGAAVVEGRDTFLDAVRGVCDRAAASWEYRELDPDVFGEEIEQNDAYRDVERIAAVALVATAP